MMTETHLQSFLDYCFWQTHDKFTKIMNPLGFTADQANVFCGSLSEIPANFYNKVNLPLTFNAYLNLINQDMSSQYKCAAPSHCSRRELLAIQWTSSNVTLNPVSYIEMDSISKGNSITTWVPNTNISHFAFEFKNFADYNKTIVPTMTNNEATLMVSYDRLLSPLSVARAIAEFNLNKTSTWSEKTFYFPDAQIFDNYIKYAVIEGFFEGLTINTTFKEIAFGFESKPLKYLKAKDPMAGGDPTIETTVSMIKPDETYQQIRHTGQGDYKQNDAFYSMNNLTHINYNASVFNGKEVYNEMKSPWGDNINFQGGDNLFGPRLTKESKPVAFQPDFFRIFNFAYDSEKTYKGGD